MSERDLVRCESWIAKTLLRREHTAVVRLVHKMKRYGMGSYIMLPKHDGMWISYEQLLDALAKRKKG